jgi:hypothetical protein
VRRGCRVTHSQPSCCPRQRVREDSPTALVCVWASPLASHRQLLTPMRFSPIFNKTIVIMVSTIFEADPSRLVLVATFGISAFPLEPCQVQAVASGAASSRRAGLGGGGARLRVPAGPGRFPTSVLMFTPCCSVFFPPCFGRGEPSAVSVSWHGGLSTLHGTNTLLASTALPPPVMSSSCTFLLSCDSGQAAEFFADFRPQSPHVVARVTGRFIKCMHLPV